MNIHTANYTSPEDRAAAYDRYLAERSAKRQAECAILREVATMGQAQGLWTIRKVYDDAGSDDRSPANPGAWRWVEVFTPEGYPFTLSSQSKDGAITARLAALEVGPHKVHAGDLREASPEAHCSQSRGAATILKDLVRRVINNPQARATAAAMAKRLAEIQARAGGLAAHMDALRAMGYSFHNIKEGEAYEARAYKSGAPMLTVTADGTVRFDARCTMANLPAVLAAIGKQD